LKIVRRLESSGFHSRQSHVGNPGVNCQLLGFGDRRFVSFTQCRDRETSGENRQRAQK
jgi:hypothetical protein